MVMPRVDQVHSLPVLGRRRVACSGRWQALWDALLLPGGRGAGREAARGRLAHPRRGGRRWHAAGVRRVRGASYGDCQLPMAAA